MGHKDFRKAVVLRKRKDKEENSDWSNRGYRGYPKNPLLGNSKYLMHGMGNTYVVHVLSITKNREFRTYNYNLYVEVFEGLYAPTKNRDGDESDYGYWGWGFMNFDHSGDYSPQHDKLCDMERRRIDEAEYAKIILAMEEVCAPDEAKVPY